MKDPTHTICCIECGEPLTATTTIEEPVGMAEGPDGEPCLVVELHCPSCHRAEPS